MYYYIFLRILKENEMLSSYVFINNLLPLDVCWTHEIFVMSEDDLHEEWILCVILNEMDDHVCNLKNF